MLWIGAAVVILTFAAIIKKRETRVCLLLGGFLMCVIAGKPIMGIEAFAKTMTNPLVATICSIMGFSYVLKFTKCDQHLVRLMTGGIGRFPLLLIPGAVLITFLINIPMASAAGCAAAVGAILIPVLIKNGVHPAMAAAAVLAGTWGAVLKPGNAHLAYIEKIGLEAGASNVSMMEILIVRFVPTLIVLAFVVAAVTLVSYLLKENSGYASEEEIETAESSEKINYLMAVTPIVPLVMYILAGQQFGILPRYLENIPFVMLIGAVLATLVTRNSPEKIAKEFWNGAGSAFGSVMGLIISASVFTAGMTAIGITDQLIAVMKQSQDMAKFGAVAGNFIIAVVSGSGDAATYAFNGSVTPFAADFGLTVPQLGSLAQIGGALGRNASPVASAAIICAAIAKVSPMEITKRNLPVMVLAAVLLVFVL